MLRLNSGRSSLAATPRSIHPLNDPPSVLTAAAGAAAAVTAAGLRVRPMLLLLLLLVVVVVWRKSRAARGCRSREGARSRRRLMMVVGRGLLRRALDAVDARIATRERSSRGGGGAHARVVRVEA